jgi:hypothetical protein
MGKYFLIHAGYSYNGHMLMDLGLGDVVRLRKPHPCGSREWVVVRLGADIGIRCLGCGHRILMERRELAKRMKTILPRGNNDATATESKT